MLQNTAVMLLIKPRSVFFLLYAAATALSQDCSSGPSTIQLNDSPIYLQARTGDDICGAYNWTLTNDQKLALEAAVAAGYQAANVTSVARYIACVTTEDSGTNAIEISFFDSPGWNDTFALKLVDNFLALRGYHGDPGLFNARMYQPGEHGDSGNGPKVLGDIYFDSSVGNGSSYHGTAGYQTFGQLPCVLAG